MHLDSFGRIYSIDQGPRNQAFSYFDSGDAANGYLESATDAAFQTTSFTRDSFGRETSETTNAAVTSMSWDGLGNLTSLTPPDQPAHVMSYTPVSLVSQYTPPVLASVVSPETKYTYDEDRRLKKVTRPDGEVLNFGYDTVGRLATIQGSAGTVTRNYYDSSVCASCAPGQLKQVLHPSQGVTIGFTYDGSLSKEIAWSGIVGGFVGWLYDANFQRVEESVYGTSGSGSIAKFGYDDDDLMTCASLSACNPAGPGSLTLTRDPSSGRLSGTALGSLTTVVTLNAFGELAVDTATAGSTTQFQEKYDSPGHPRDALGRVLRQIEQLENTGTITTRDYEYDSHSRLWKVTDGGTGTLLRTYSYDKNGNRLGVTSSSGPITASYDAQDRLESYGTYTYTNNGELRTKTDTATSAVTTYTYDVFGNLKKVELPNSDVIEYIVDGQNRRVAKKKNGNVVNRWLYHDDLHPIAELNANGTIAKRFVYASGKNTPDMMIQGSTTYRILSDQLGSPRLVFNTSTPTAPARMRHDEFGNVLEDTVSALIPFGFAGGLYDPDTGLVRFGARDYDPVVGRWISKDPIIFSGKQANLYVYAGNDPVNRKDPSGLCDDPANADDPSCGGGEGGGNTPSEVNTQPDAFGDCLDRCMKDQGADKAAEVALMCLPFAPTPKTPWELAKTPGGGSPLTTWASRLSFGLGARNPIRTAGKFAAEVTAVPFAAASGYWAGSAAACFAECAQ